MAVSEIVFLGCGDVGPFHEPMAPYSTLASPVLAMGDIRFAHCERVYSDNGSLQIHGVKNARVKPHMSSVFNDCGFNVVSLAGNLAMDWGEDALLDTIKLFNSAGIQTVGAGRDQQAAHAPAFVEHNGVRVAILAYCSVPKHGYGAGPRKAGVALLRAHTYYETVEEQPGLPPRVVTVPYDEDLDAMVQDIAQAKQTAHAVVVSFHWGVHHIPRVIADYQTITANAAFNAGADLIVGHHAHVPKAIANHSGKVCFYSLGNFIMTTEASGSPGWAERFIKRYGVDPDPEDCPRLPFGPDSRRSLIAKAVFSTGGVKKVSFLPVQIDKQLRPQVLNHDDPRFPDAVKFMNWVSEGYPHKFSVEGSEVVIENT